MVYQSAQVAQGVLVERIANNGKERFVRGADFIEAIKNSVVHPVVAVPMNNAGRTGVEIRFVCQDGPMRIYLWDDGREHFGPAPGDINYGPGGVDTGW